jgi:hypothetical protein
MRLTVFLIALLLAPIAARAQETIHADLPIWTSKDHVQMWPQGFVGVDEWGCTSRVAFGDWKFDPVPSEDDFPREGWWRITNYGVFHCYAMVRWAHERANLTDASVQYSFFVKMAEIGTGAARVELWALQMGVRPGSDYVLLARKPSEGIVQAFDVLDVQCPSANVRDAGQLGTISTDYCSINSKAELIAFAGRMARRPYAGKLVRMGDEPEADDAEPVVSPAKAP